MLTENEQSPGLRIPIVDGSLPQLHHVALPYVEDNEREGVDKS